MTCPQFWYHWTVDLCGGTSSDQYQIKITDVDDANCYDFSDYFPLDFGCSIDVTEPGGYPPWYEGSTEHIQWNSHQTSGVVKIELFHNGSFLCTIDSSEPDDGDYATQS